LTPTDLPDLEEQWDRHALVYDLVYGETEHERAEQELRFMEHAFDELARRPIRDVLDLTAGTGLQAVALARQGLRVTAADISAAMLERCRARAAAAGVTLAGLVRRSAIDTDEVERFDACVSCFFGLSHLVTEDQLGRVFAAAHRALRSGGLLVFDLINLLEDALLSAPRSERAGVRDGVRFRSVMESRYDTWSSLLHFSEQTEVANARGEKRTVRAEFTYRGWSRSEVLALLERAGFEHARAFRGYEDLGRGAEERVFKLVFACRK
jgi:SAM-dependent methyltransferase